MSDLNIHTIKGCYWLYDCLVICSWLYDFPCYCQSINIVLQPSPFFPNLYLTSNLLLTKMVRTRSQLENLSKDEVIYEWVIYEKFKNDINAKFSELNDRFNDFQAKYKMVNSNLSVSRCCNDLLLERITQLEHNNLNNAQYNRRETQN